MPLKMFAKKFASKNITNISANNSFFVTTFQGDIFQYKNNKEISSITLNIPVLSSLATSKNLVYISTAQGHIISIDLLNQSYETINTLIGGIDHIHLYESSIVCGGWDNKISLFNNSSVVKLSHPTYYSDLCNETFICASEKFISAFDLRNYDKPFFEAEVGKEIKSVKLLNNETFVLGSKDGKIKIDSFNEGKININFVGHKSVIDDINYLFAVESLDVYEGRLFSCGSDGRIIEWDIDKKRRRKVWHAGEGRIRQSIIYDNKLYYVEDMLGGSLFGEILL